MQAAAADAGELVWRMPLHERFAELIKGSTADLANMSPPRTGASSTAAAFLHRFTGDVPWAHLDIAGPAFVEKDTPTGPKGATGAPVRTMLCYLMSQG